MCKMCSLMMCGMCSLKHEKCENCLKAPGNVFEKFRSCDMTNPVSRLGGGGGSADLHHFLILPVEYSSLS